MRRDVLAAPNVRLAGLHCHIGSQIFALHSFREAADVMVEFMARIRDSYGYESPELDLGGGLGIAYTADDVPSSIEDFAEVTVGRLRSSAPSAAFRAPPFGGARAQPCGQRGRDAVHRGHSEDAAGHPQVRGGRRRHVRQYPHGAVPRRLRAGHREQGGRAPRTEIVTIAGKHCESGDAVVIDMPLQHPDLGTMSCACSRRARTATLWPATTNGQPRPGRRCSCATRGHPPRDLEASTSP